MMECWVLTIVNSGCDDDIISNTEISITVLRHDPKSAFIEVDSSEELPPQVNLEIKLYTNNLGNPSLDLQVIT